MATCAQMRVASCRRSRGSSCNSSCRTSSSGLAQPSRCLRSTYRRAGLPLATPATASRARVQRGCVAVHATYASEEEPQISPMVPRSDAAGMVELQQYLLLNRAIILGGRITDKVATTVVGQLLALEAQDATTPIRVYINSMGGSTYSALGSFDVMRSLKCPVSTVGMGLVAGTATVLLAAGTKGERYIMPNARVMIQQPNGGAMGSVFDVREPSKELGECSTHIPAFASVDTESFVFRVDRKLHISRKQC